MSAFLLVPGILELFALDCQFNSFRLVVTLCLPGFELGTSSSGGGRRTAQPTNLCSCDHGRMSDPAEAGHCCRSRGKD